MAETTKTFRELYELEQQKPTAAAGFLQRVAEVAGVSYYSARNWAVGRSVPNPSACKLLSEHFGCAIEQLFPELSNTTR